MKIVVFIFLLSTLLIGANYSDAVKIKKIYPMGQKIHKVRCASLSATPFESYDALLDALQKQELCGRLNPKHTEVLAIYLWDHRDGAKQHHFEKLTVSKEEKCPVCGMYLYKYPEWISKMVLEGKEYFFDGVKDMMKFYFSHNAPKDATLLAQEYYTHKTIDAKKAYFVLGSDLYGPMGDELIAFESKEKAQQFLLDHRGKKIVHFSELTQEVVEHLDQ